MTTVPMKISAIAPWFGGKRNLASRIIRLLGPHQSYWEPFCGSMAVLLSKSACSMETVNDLHGDLINLARVLQIESTALMLYARLNRTLLSEDLYLTASERCRQRGNDEPAGEPDVERAYDYFLWSWMGRNGCSGVKGQGWGFSARYTSNGGHAAKRFVSVVESIPAWHQRLRGVTILSRNGLDVLDRIEDKKGTVVYCDPPYLVKGAQYVHDFDDDDHGRLAAVCRRFRKTRLVVSYYDHPRLSELYPGWSRHCINVTKSIAHHGSRGKNAMRANEVLLVNDNQNVSLLFE